MAEFGKERSARAQAAFEANLAGIHAQNAQNDWVAGEASLSEDLAAMEVALEYEARLIAETRAAARCAGRAQRG